MWRKQWGTTTTDAGGDGGGNIVFPLTFSTLYAMFGGAQSYGHGGFTVGGDTTRGWGDAESQNYTGKYWILAIGA